MSKLKPIIIQASQTGESANEIVKRAGIIITEDLTANQMCGDHRVWWTYNGKKIPRPPVRKWEETILKEFGIKIKYTALAKSKVKN